MPPVNRAPRITGHQPLASPLLPLITLVLALTAPSLAACGEKDEPEPAAAEPTTQAGGGFDILGSWKGELRQKGVKPFRVTARIGSLDDPKQNEVSYTGIDCAGNWTYLRDGESFRFREVIDRGEGGRCKGTGTVTLTPTQGGRLEYLFRGGGIESRGVLTRVG
jgi:hypothetical protein